MQNKKLMAVPMLLVFALVTFGFAYAHWSQNLYIEGTVDTGELDWGFTSVSCDDSEDGEKDFHCYDGFKDFKRWRGDKDVGRTTCGPTDPHTVTVTLTNVYPCYCASVSVYALNTGSIPLIIQKAIVKSAYDSAQITEDNQIVKIDLDGDGKNDIEIYWGDHIGDQLEPGDPSGEISFWIHVIEKAPQGESHSFTIEIVAINWNEYVSP